MEMRKKMKKKLTNELHLSIVDPTFDVPTPNRKRVVPNSDPSSTKQKMGSSHPTNQRLDHAIPLCLPTKRYFRHSTSVPAELPIA